ncbi:unnamed protein product [Effrenium voratum]|uniref:Uncharacterized protein n=1 Tax=Effrenium voratum TaxID=2562239 RepID=A0AA36HX18_9DINO|nr:unnamed protein product [Effrenium voratum]CAJ1376902.1 unnamed protein product [Effrenium voratum]CAJ1448693.1 unnamed protein product [Effrenium voratum]|mmetsp:Transcript_32778/g.78392  ORF Transcript_32778/g.78392 Transcript_32778/m.78392 type:complete len:294 (-) Transcript_32778:48-929(-)
MAFAILLLLQYALADPGLMRRGVDVAKRQPLMRSHKNEHEVFETKRPMRRPIFPRESRGAEASEDFSKCGQWSIDAWSQWSICSVGKRVRTRDAVGLAAEYQFGSNLTTRSEKSLRLPEGMQAARWSGRLLVSEPGRYSFHITGLRLKLGAAFVADADHADGKSFKRWLPQGGHSILLEARAPSAGVLKYSGPDTAGRVLEVPWSVLRHEPEQEELARGVKSSACSFVETESCAGAVDCAWGDWAAWGRCSATCGGSMQRARRVAVRAQRGGKACDADSDASEQAPCAPCRFW